MKKTPILHFLLWGLVLCLGLVAGPALAQSATGSITGRIIDAQGEGLPGVTILVQGTTKGAATDVSGSFTISDVPAGTYTVTASSVGMSTARQEVTVTAGGAATVNVTLKEDATQLSEVVVVGYGTTRRQDVTGSVATVDSRDFIKGQVVNPANLVSGKIAGVSITPPSGAPGSSAPIRIRGGSSLNASNDPLLVIDGVPVDNHSLAGSPDVLSTLNPNDIETFTVLKDASATAIYGSRASNGVIIITTKKGLRGEKLKLNFSTLFSAAKNYRKVDVLSADEYRAFMLDSVVSESRPQYSLATATQRKWVRQYPNQSTDWQDEIYRTAYTSDNNLSLTGSIAEKLPFRASVGYLNQQGTLRGGNLKRNTASLGITPMLLDDHLRIDLNVKGIWSDHVFVEEGAIGSAVTFDPTKPVRSNDPVYAPFGGYWQWTTAAGALTSLAPRNPLGLLEQNRNRSTVKRSIGNAQFEYKLHFLPELKATLNLGYDIARGNGTQIIPREAASNINGLQNEYAEKKDNKLLDAYLNYSKDVLAGLRLDLTAGYSYQDFRYRNPQLRGARNFGDTLANAQNQFQPAQDAGYDLLSWFGRANLAFKDRYLLTGTLRNDRSTRFGPKNRSGWFPAAAFAWRVKGEDFLASSTAISDLKLRVGYGETGQQDVNDNYYPYLARYRFGTPTVQYPVGSQGYVTTLRPNGYNENLKWETTATYNAGLDYGFMDNRVFGAVDVYVRKTTDLLAFVNVPAGSNLTNQLYVNIGAMENRGIEASVNVVPVRNDNMTWTLNLNATYNKQKVTKLIAGEDADFRGFPTGGIGGGTANNIQLFSVGYPAKVFYVYEQKYKNGRPEVDASGNPVFVDRDTTGQHGATVIDQRDQYQAKQSQPKVFMGFSSNLQWKNFGLAFTMRSQFGGYIYRNVASNSSFYQRIKQSGWIQNTTPDILQTGFSTDKSLFSDYYLQKSDFLRMDNITLSYNFGSLIKEGTNLGVSLAVQNAFLITDYEGVDPEVFGGIDNNFYPRPRIFTIGLNASF